MPGPLVHVLASGNCPHGGKIALQTTNTRVFVNGMAVITATDLLSIAGCPFQIPVPPGTKPQPCVIARVVPAGRVFINGVQAALVNSPGGGVCQSIEQIPQGAPILVTQTRVVAQ
ncbi:MAG: hypothetical protein ACTHMP_03140 [Thermomicrobiales bacterium]